MDVDVDKYKFYSQTEFKVQKENMEYFLEWKGFFLSPWAYRNEHLGR